MMATRRISTRAGRAVGHDEIAAVLGAEILSGARPPGTRVLTEEELLARFGASRVLMREVSKTLAAKGMVVAKSRVGTLVLPPEYWNWFDADVLAWRLRLGLDQEFFKQLAQMRRAVEPAAAALAAEQRTQEHLDAMRQALSAMSRAGGDRHAFAEADLDFHLAVASASGNPLFRSLASVIETALGAYLTLSTAMQSETRAASVQRHALIADAIERRDGDAAIRCMLSVIDESLDRIIAGRD
jgi:DNA-binding FadR family transcriptional regulator